MATTKTIELTEVEGKLRQLLLDVGEYIDSNPLSAELESTTSVPDELAKSPLELRFTGGWVRDKLLGTPSHDIDVAINKMTGYQFGLKMKEYLEIPGNAEKYGLESKDGKGDGKRKMGAGLYKIEANPEKSKHLETVTTKILGLDIDLVNLRKETYSEDSRNPQMEFGTPEEDALRRDATVNALFYNLNKSIVEDFTGRGFQDMELKIIRTPLEPYQTFKDDPLRVLRLIRFASRLGYKIDPSAEESMGNPDIKGALRLKISRERVGIEVEKMLRGPDPYGALDIINRLGLYDTIFTDPTNEMKSKPETQLFKRAYDCVSKLLSSQSSPAKGILFRDDEERYLGWIAASVIPWVDAPMIEPKKGKPIYAAHAVVREGIKAPNKVCTVVTDSMRHIEEIRALKDKFIAQKRNPAKMPEGEDATARDVLGMAIRRWGPTWRTQVLCSLLYETSNSPDAEDGIIQDYTVFLTHLRDVDVLEAYTLKPLLDGKTLAKALSTNPGPWMKDALDVVMAWQLRHPDATDPAAAIEAVKDKQNSELPVHLATHFLSLTIRPLFSATQAAAARKHAVTAAGRRRSTRDDDAAGPRFRDIAEIAHDNDDEAEAERKLKPWKLPQNAYALDLLRWCLTSGLNEDALERHWPLLVPPILTITDDIDLATKTTGIELLHLLLHATPPALLHRTGLGPIFHDALEPALTYTPPSTPLPTALPLLNAAYSALLTLATKRWPTPSPPSPQPRLNLPPTALVHTLTHTLHTHLLPHLHPRALPHLPPAFPTTLLHTLTTYLHALRLASIPLLPSLLPPLTAALSDPLLPTAAPDLFRATARALRALCATAWPRLPRWRADVLAAVAVAWGHVRDGVDEWVGQAAEALRAELRALMRGLGAVCGAAAGREGFDWRAEVRGLVGVDGRLGGLVEGLVGVGDVGEREGEGEVGM